jgi:hypothetical protein
VVAAFVGATIRATQKPPVVAALVAAAALDTAGLGAAITVVAFFVASTLCGVDTFAGFRVAHRGHLTVARELAGPAQALVFGASNAVITLRRTETLHTRRGAALFEARGPITAGYVLVLAAPLLAAIDGTRIAVVAVEAATALALNTARATTPFVRPTKPVTT